ncbi:MAG: bifunctional UDP-sugar hydrolase/5'-nucleotidase [Anaerovoracaceae bacterium]
MKKRNKVLVLLLTICMVFVMIPSASFAADAKTGDIVVLYTNDVHCAVDSNIGYAGLAAYKADKLKQTEYVTLVDAGDALQGDVMGTLSKGEYLVDIMNKTGYDVLVPGNHEFDYGMDQFFKLAKASNAKYVCANFIDLKTNKAVFDPYVMKTYGKTKVAYVGIDTPEAISKAAPAYFQDKTGKYIYDFCNDKTGEKLYKAVQTAVDAAKADGANYVIAVGHLGIDAQSSPWTSKDVIANTSGIDALIDGHSHSTIANEQVKNKAGANVTLTSTGTKLAAIGELVISDGKISTNLVTKYEGKDQAVQTVVEKYNKKIEALTKKVVAKSNVDLTIFEADGKTRAIRNQETNLGDLCADAYKAISGADVAIVNGGGIRADIKAGDVTYGQIIAVHPYGNMLCMVKATGQELLDALEMASRTCPSENGGFLQVAGMTYDIDTTVPSTVVINDKNMFVKVEGARRVVNAKINGVAVDPKKTYTVASHDFMLHQQGDGLNMFMDNEFVLDKIMIDNQVLINYIEENLGGVIDKSYAKRQGRIGIISSQKVNSNDALDADKTIVTLCKDAAACTTKITSLKVTSKRINAKINGNAKADGFYYKTVNSKGTKVSYKYSTKNSYTTKTLAKGKYTVKVVPYTYVAGERVYGKTISKKIIV